MRTPAAIAVLTPAEIREVRLRMLGCGAATPASQRVTTAYLAARFHGLTPASPYLSAL